MGRGNNRKAEMKKSCIPAQPEPHFGASAFILKFTAVITQYPLDIYIYIYKAWVQSTFQKSNVLSHALEYIYIISVVLELLPL